MLKRFLLSTSFLRMIPKFNNRSEEHTSELQSRENLVCRLLLEKKKEVISSHLRLPGVAWSQCSGRCKLHAPVLHVVAPVYALKLKKPTPNIHQNAAPAPTHNNR